MTEDGRPDYAQELGGHSQKAKKLNTGEAMRRGGRQATRKIQFCLNFAPREEGKGRPAGARGIESRHLRREKKRMPGEVAKARRVDRHTGQKAEWDGWRQVKSESKHS